MPEVRHGNEPVLSPDGLRHDRGHRLSDLLPDRERRRLLGGLVGARSSVRRSGRPCRRVPGGPAGREERKSSDQRQRIANDDDDDDDGSGSQAERSADHRSRSRVVADRLGDLLVLEVPAHHGSRSAGVRCGVDQGPRQLAARVPMSRSTRECSRLDSMRLGRGSYPGRTEGRSHAGEDGADRTGFRLDRRFARRSRRLEGRRTEGPGIAAVGRTARGSLGIHDRMRGERDSGAVDPRSTPREAGRRDSRRGRRGCRCESKVGGRTRSCGSRTEDRQPSVRAWIREGPSRLPGRR